MWGERSCSVEVSASFRLNQVPKMPSFWRCKKITVIMCWHWCCPAIVRAEPVWTPPTRPLPGRCGQTFRLLHTPILALDPSRDALIVEPPGSSKAQRWQEKVDFADSGPEDRHFTLDKLDGSLTLGPSLLQPDGHISRFGAVPD